ncbi:MAG: hypothetical protein WCF93_00600 [Candidatus Moraniibacteriota bacterium]
MQDNIEKLRNGKWSDKYFCKLSLLDHLRECLEKDNFLKATDAAKDSIGYANLDKELMDLKIILDFYFIGKENLHIERIEKFVKNLEK